MKLKLNRIKEIFIILVYVYTIFTFYVNGIPETIQTLLLYVIYFIYILVNYRILTATLFSKRSIRIILHVLLLLSVMIFLVIVVPVFHQSYDFSYYKIPVSILLNTEKIIFLLIFSIKHARPENLLFYFFKHYLYAITFYVCCTIIMIIFPSFKEIWSYIIISSDKELMLSGQIYYVSRYGLVGFSGFKETWICSMGSIMALFLLTQNSVSLGIKKYRIYLYLIFCLVGNAFYGRTGLLASIICILIFVIYTGLIRGKIHQMIFGGVLLILLYYFAFILKDLNETFNHWYTWAMTPINNLLSSRSFNNYSVDNMYSMYFMPSVKTFLFGDGFYTSPITGGYYMSTDIGLMRPLLFYGVFGQIAGYLIPLSLIKGIVKEKQFFLATILLIVAIMFEMKGEAFNLLISILVGIVLSNSYNKRNSIKEKEGWQK